MEDINLFSLQRLSDADDRTITAATVATSIAVHMGLLSGRWVVFWWPWVFKFMPDLWRPFSSFLLTGPQFGIIMDPYFCRYGGFHFPRICVDKEKQCIHMENHLSPNRPDSLNLAIFLHILPFCGP